MWTVWTWDWLFVMATGAALLGAIISLAAGLAYAKNDDYIPAAITLAGLATYSMFEGIGINKDPGLIRYSYAMLALSASVLPWMTWRILGGKHGRIFILLPLFGAVIASSALSQAFPDLHDLEFGCYEVLSIKWAFWATAGFAALVGLGSGIWSLEFAIKPGRLDNFKKGMILSTGSLLFTVSIILQAVADCKLAAVGNGWAGAGTIVLAMAISMIPVLDGLAERHAHEQCHKQLERQEVISIRDPLTGLFNRGYFFEVLNRSMERLKRDGDVFGLILVDLDDFKLVNDRFGHPAGDYSLSAVSKVIMHSCRAYDCPARYGGDEFIILITYNTDKESLEKIASRMYKGISDLRLPYGTTEITITATMGVMLVKDGNMRHDKILRMVDDAMYKGKQKGKGQLVTV